MILDGKTIGFDEDNTTPLAYIWSKKAQGFTELKVSSDFYRLLLQELKQEYWPDGNIHGVKIIQAG